MSKSHSRTYLKLKLDSSNILCGRVYSVYNGLLSKKLLKIFIVAEKDLYFENGSLEGLFSGPSVFSYLGILHFLHCHPR